MNYNYTTNKYIIEELTGTTHGFGTPLSALYFVDNVGGGAELIYKQGNYVIGRTLVEGPGINISGTGDTITISANVTGSTGGTNITASNGLTKVGDDIQLGGALTAETTILIDGNTLNLSNGNVRFSGATAEYVAGSSIYVGDTSYIQMNTDNGAGLTTVANMGIGFFSIANNQAGVEASIGMDGGGLRLSSNFLTSVSLETTSSGYTRLNIIEDSSRIQVTNTRLNFSGITYDDDYSANFTPRSLVDRGYVDSLVGSGTQHRSGTTIAFDQPATYGYTSAETGVTITLDSTGFIEGITQLLVHNHTTEPTFGSEFKIISGEYVISVDNYVMFLGVKSNLILTTISQEL